MMRGSWVALAALSGTAAGMGLGHGATKFKRDIKLSAELGIHPDILLGQRTSVAAVAGASLDQNVKAEYVSLPIDHSNHSVGFYQNRYWASTDHYKEGGPVFIYDVGEATAESSAQVHLGNSSSFFYQMLEEFGGVGIVWEHRYYGDSLPFPVNKDTPSEHFQYLNNRQALADIPYFAQNFTRDSLKDVDLTSYAQPWVMVGGSYAGMRSAFTRNEYPDSIFASFASSAPVQAKIDMSVYFDQVYAGLVAYGYSNCTKDIKAAVEYIDEQLSRNKSSAAAIKKQFFGDGAENNSHGDFTAALTGIFQYFQSYGLAGGSAGLGSFCEHMETDGVTGRPAPPTGFARFRGKEYAAKRWASWPVFTQLINFNFETNCKQLDPSEDLSCILSPPAVDPDTISWTWQYCDEWGYFQTINKGPHALLSKYQSLDYAQFVCNRQFPEAAKSGLLPPQPRAKEMNQQTGGWTIRPSNVYWSGGQFDPWRTLSPLATGNLAPQNVAFTTDIPACNVQTDEDTLFGYIMDNAEHCFDFRTSFEPGKPSRNNFHQALKKWLPCFKPTEH
ncbi:uncharacterized protein N7511_002985 [Penicillium nucicola]|uniref:uncharacterized protein n=1 Tax=Penicillium nucicola TaxID=1850975 RepID=UPI0025459204|nr:uncharacterized protein N7511_002985 [Penicillium nucicola]KAJ5770934.1 hypothetical protein N7511_002985 [Penicillium nucicola]